jgi:hypothetical protein
VRRAWKIAAAGTVAFLATSGAATAVASAGTFTRGAGLVTFFYGRSSGNADGNRVTGLDHGMVCGNVPGSAQRTMFVMEFRQDKRLFPDHVLDRVSALYSDGRKHTERWELATSSRYYPYAAWNYNSADGRNATGYTKLC